MIVQNIHNSIVILWKEDCRWNTSFLLIFDNSSEKILWLYHRREEPLLAAEEFGVSQILNKFRIHKRIILDLIDLYECM